MVSGLSPLPAALSDVQSFAHPCDDLVQRQVRLVGNALRSPPRWGWFHGAQADRIGLQHRSLQNQCRQTRSSTKRWKSLDSSRAKFALTQPRAPGLKEKDRLPTTGENDVKRIGLCMIVKNELKVILRCLESVRPIVDYVLIEDTGSTDATQEIIRQWIKRVGLPGEVYDEPWRDFAYNRSHVLARLRQQEQLDYALILDADDYIVLEPDFDVTKLKRRLKADLYEVELRNPPLSYHREQICSNKREFLYRGVLHEFIDTADGARSWKGPEVTVGRVNGFYIVSTREGDRGDSPDKYLADAVLLERHWQRSKIHFSVAATRSIWLAAMITLARSKKRSSIS